MAREKRENKNKTGIVTSAIINESFMQCHLLSVIIRDIWGMNEHVESTWTFHNPWAEKIIAEVDELFRTLHGRKEFIFNGIIYYSSFPVP